MALFEGFNGIALTSMALVAVTSSTVMFFACIDGDLVLRSFYCFVSALLDDPCLFAQRHLSYLRYVRMQSQC